MKVIVDANIVFSALLNTNGKIGDLLLNSNNLIEFIAPRYLDREIKKYFQKIANRTGKSIAEIDRIHFKIMKVISFFSVDLIPQENWKKAYKMVSDIDEKDTPYVAFAEYLQIKIWTGDKKLSVGLIEKGFNLTISTKELYNYRQKILKSKKY